MVNTQQVEHREALVNSEFAQDEFGDVIKDMWGNAGETIEAEFKSLNVPYRLEVKPDRLGTHTVHCYATESGAKIVSDSLEAKGIEHQWGMASEFEPAAFEGRYGSKYRTGP